MPLNVQLVNAQVKDPQSGQMTPAGLIGSDAISTINTAKNQAVAAVQQKGVETLESIPDDYTALSNEVDEVKTQINDLDEKLYDRFPGFVQYNLSEETKFNAEKYENRNSNIGTVSGSPVIRLENLSNYVSYVFTITAETKIACIANSATYYAITYLTNPESDSWTTDGSGTMYIKGDAVSRLRKSDNNLPTESSPLTLQAGTLVAITVKSGENPIIAVEEIIVDNVIKQSNFGEKYPYFDVEMHNAYFYYYMPTNCGKWLRYKFNHYTNANKNADSWMQREVDLVSEDKETVILHIVRDGEWEMAIKLSDAHDFIGGEIHGSEVATIVKFYFDGLEKSIVDGENISCSEIKVNEKTTLYNPGAVSGSYTTDIVGYHYRTYKITVEGIEIQQRIEWVDNLEADASYVMMMPAIRGQDNESPVQITDRAYDDYNYLESDVATRTFSPSSIGAKIERGNTLCLYGTGSKVSIDSMCFIKDKPETSFAYLSNAEYYNKWYYAYCNSIPPAQEGEPPTYYTINSGDKWEWKSKYIIRYEGE